MHATPSLSPSLCEGLCEGLCEEMSRIKRATLSRCSVERQKSVYRLRTGLYAAHEGEKAYRVEAPRGDVRRTERELSACFESAEVGVWIDQTGGVCGGGRVGRWASR